MAHNSSSFGGSGLPNPQALQLSSRLFVGGLPAGTTESQLYNYFRKFGALHHVSIPPSVKRKAKLFAFVQFAHVEDAQLAMEQSRIVPFDDGRLLSVNLAASEEMKSVPIKKKPRFKVLLSAIPFGTDVGQVAKAASVFGQLLKISPYKTYSAHTFGCRVKFATLESAFQILKHRLLVLENGITIQVKPYYSQSDKTTEEFFTNLEQKYTLRTQFVRDIEEFAPRPMPIRRCLVLHDQISKSENIASRNEQLGFEFRKKFQQQRAYRTSDNLGQRDRYFSGPANVRFNLKARR